MSFEKNDKAFSFLMALCAVLVLAIPVGIANIWLGFVNGESPCTLCWNERMGMITFGVLSLFMVRYGPRLKYIGLMMITAAWGLFMTLRHVSMCAATSEMGYGFGTAILGAHTYTWGFFVYWMVVFVLGGILWWFSRDAAFVELMKGKRPDARLSGFSTTAYALCFAVILSNAFQAFFQNGIPPFDGQGDPTRFTMDLSTAGNRWTTTVWSRIGKGFSLAGDFKIDDSYIPGATQPSEFVFNLKTEDGAIENLKPAPKLLSEEPLFFEARGIWGEGNAAGITWVPTVGEWAVAGTRGGIWYVDADMKKVVRSGVIDVVNGSDIPWTVDIAWVGDKAVAAGRNKVIWATAPRAEGAKVDSFREWSIWRETTGNIESPWGPKRKSMRTIRAKKAWAGAISAGPGGDSFYMMSLPNHVTKTPVLSKFDAGDQVLSAEAPLRAGNGIKLREGRNLSDYYVIGMTEHQGKLLAFSRQYSTLLTVDPATARVVEAHAMPEMQALHSMTIRGDELVMFDRRDGKDWVVRFDLKTL